MKTLAQREKHINEAADRIKKKKAQRDIFYDLLAIGYLPKQLPPPFSTKNFAESVKKLSPELREILAQATGKPAKLCRYNLARPQQLRRVLAIVNPIYHLCTSLEVAANWDALKKASNGSEFSVSKPTRNPTVKQRRAFEFSEGWEVLPERRLKNRIDRKYILKTDIARFFPSIYTHSIPWALHTKATAKKKPIDFGLLGNRLDYWIRNAQEQQTLGIPIGPPDA